MMLNAKTSSLPTSLPQSRKLLSFFEELLESDKTDETNNEFSDTASVLQAWRGNTFHDACEVGTGGFGTVWKVKLNPSSRKYFALKVVRRTSTTDELHEFKLQKQINHVNIVKAFGVFQTNKSNVMILEYCSRGDLHDYMNDLGPTKCLSRTKKYLRHVASALRYLHSKLNYLHMDLKPENILVSARDVAKICDFGCVVQMEDYRKTLKGTQGGTVFYRPPELIERGIYDSTIDVWAFGCIAFELIFRRHPFFSHCVCDVQETHEESWCLRYAIRSMHDAQNGKLGKEFETVPNDMKDFFLSTIGSTRTERPLSLQLHMSPWLRR